jgi:hypothetical protein
MFNILSHKGNADQNYTKLGNPRYSGSRDQKDQSQPRKIVCETLSQKNPS